MNHLKIQFEGQQANMPKSIYDFFINKIGNYYEQIEFFDSHDLKTFEEMTEELAAVEPEEPIE